MARWQGHDHSWAIDWQVMYESWDVSNILAKKNSWNHVCNTDNSKIWSIVYCRKTDSCWF